MRLGPVVGRERERTRLGEVASIDGNVRALAEDVDGPGGRVEPDDLVRDVGGAGDVDDRRSVGVDVVAELVRVVRNIEVEQLARLGIDDREVRPAVAVVPADDRPVAEERERALVELPLRVAELRLRGMDHASLAVADRLEVPPPAPVAREDEVAARAPRRLPDGLLAAAPGDVANVVERPVGGDGRHEQLATVPRHPRKVPGEERDARAVGGDPGAGVEVASARDDPGLVGPVERYQDELVHDVDVPVAFVPFADADPARPVGGDASVGEPVAALDVGGDRFRGSAVVEPVQPLVGLVREDHGAPAHGVGAAAVAVGAGSDVGALARHVLRLAGRIRSHEDGPPALGGATLEPIRQTVVQPRLRQPHGVGRQHLGRDRRRPGAVGRDDPLGGPHLGRPADHDARHLQLAALRALDVAESAPAHHPLHVAGAVRVGLDQQPPLRPQPSGPLGDGALDEPEAVDAAVGQRVLGLPRPDFRAFRQLYNSGNVGGAEIELRPITVEKWRMTAAFFFGQHIGLGMEIGVWRNAARFSQNLPRSTSSRLVPRSDANIIASLPSSSSLRNISTPVANRLYSRP